MPMNKHERTYAVIRERILSGGYGPGHRLVLDTIAKELSVSAVPVREALRRLEAEGWVIYRRNAGAQVAPVDSSTWEAVMHALALLEGYATALAAPHLSEADIEDLRYRNQAAAHALEKLDLIEFTRLNRVFHFAIYGTRCPNPYLVELLGDTWDRLDAIRRTVFTSIPNRGWDSVTEHDELIALIEGRAGRQEIESAARMHKLRTIEAYNEAATRPQEGIEQGETVG